ncbi:MAG TPA: low molecular weight protein-tyrosine-phosphatase [Mycobacteriales bacterium]|nr:low molecular weight protein-tyrosine-phosphatase [Mycobacteriales bacterium]
MAREPVRICFVCTGNICRSPTAEVVMRHLVDEAGLSDRIVVDSAGTAGYHLGDDADPRSRAVLEAAGYSFDHVARRFESSWFADRDLVIALDSGHRDLLLRAAHTPEERAKVHRLREWDPEARRSGDKDVPDPYYGGDRGFDDVLEMVERSCEGLLEHVRAQLGA